MADELNSWKELANYLGCSVRTVQRWEAERGLPVRRLPGHRGSVFALRAEVEQWRLGQGSDMVSSENRRVRRDWRPIAIAIAAGMLVTLVALVSYANRQARPSIPVTFVLQTDAIVAIDASGRPAWTFALPANSVPVDVGWRPAIGGWAQMVDVDGDGVSEVVALVGRHGPDTAGRLVETLYALTDRGALRWSYTPSLSVDFTSRRSSGNWRLLDYEVVPGAGVWVSVADHMWWPSAVEQIANDGHVTTRLYHPGNIRVLRALTTSGRTVVAAAGVNNQHAAAAVMLLDPVGVATAPDQDPATYACRGCPAATPLRYVLLGPSPLVRVANRPYNVAIDLQVGPTLIASTYEDDLVNVLFTLTQNLDVEHAEPSDGYWSYAATHPSLTKLEQTVQIRDWTVSGWRSKRIRLSGGPA